MVGTKIKRLRYFGRRDVPMGEMVEGKRGL